MKLVINDPQSKVWFIVALEKEFTSRKYNIIYTGMGKINASMATQYLFEHYQVNKLINIGTAGASSKLQKDCVYEIMNFMQRDIWTSDAVRQEVSIVKPNQLFNNFTNKKYNITKLSEAIGTGDTFVKNIDNSNYTIVDMESFAIAYVCKKNNKLNNFYCLKYISDNGSENDWESSFLSANKTFNQIFNHETL